jgi:hypothetical protein
MLKYLFGLIGLALLGASPLVGQTPAWGSDAACGCGACGCATACGAQAGCDGCCNGCSQCDECKCCPHCGCKLCPVCHPYCDTKTTIKHEYTYHCKDHCVPGPEHCCKDCNGCCQDECCHCKIREIHKLVIIPVCEEEQVRKCKVEWVCPRCSGQASAVVPAAPAGPAPVANPPGPQVAPPAPKPAKMTELAPQPPDFSTAELR